MLSVILNDVERYHKKSSEKGSGKPWTLLIVLKNICKEVKYVQRNVAMKYIYIINLLLINLKLQTYMYTISLQIS